MRLVVTLLDDRGPDSDMAHRSNALAGSDIAVLPARLPVRAQGSKTSIPGLLSGTENNLWTLKQEAERRWFTTGASLPDDAQPRRESPQVMFQV